MDNQDFTYGVARIRAMETLLLGQNEVERMMLAKNAKEAFQILDELDYADNRAEVDDPQEFQKVVNEGLVDIKELLEKIAPEEEIMNIIWHKYDLHNIKTLIKAKYGEKSLEEVKRLLSPLGAIPEEALIQFIFEGKHNASFRMREESELILREGILSTCKTFEKMKNPQMIDVSMDKTMMTIIFDIAERSGSEFLVDYIQKFIDLYNIKLFFRMKVAERKPEEFDEAFMESGTVYLSKFQKAYKQGLNDLPETLKTTPYVKIIETGLKHYQEEKTFIYLEKEMENYLTETAKEAKLMSSGPEPLIAYFLAKENNALIIRMILIHKLNQIDAEEIRKRLRTLYA